MLHYLIPGLACESKWEGKMQSLCETCALMREIKTAKGSRFLLCQLSQTDPAYPRYPRQPVVRCGGFEKVRGNHPEASGEQQSPESR